MTGEPAWFIPLQDGLKRLLHASIVMMRRVLCNECTRRPVKSDSIRGEELARGIMYAFIGGMTEERELSCLVRNLID
ncbi:hypothetical protein [Rhizobium leguminosarum]|uniref:hypothetical protein n=1 Tax=Rhizobium leguminosarum TaxID=384 RepID=UPI00143F0A2D|nr:hypothetical protein [Rhizobium leguminosarum]NKL21191.1 hypothetical protein [Rhizobium leguminosarum bv. viciae]NKL56897.1 hypothetical protein [Rhizobium leguminosarum bv. viciae]